MRATIKRSINIDPTGNLWIDLGLLRLKAGPSGWRGFSQSPLEMASSVLMAFAQVDWFFTTKKTRMVLPLDHAGLLGACFSGSRASICQAIFVICFFVHGWLYNYRWRIFTWLLLEFSYILARRTFYFCTDTLTLKIPHIGARASGCCLGFMVANPLGIVWQWAEILKCFGWATVEGKKSILIYGAANWEWLGYTLLVHSLFSVLTDCISFL